MGGCGGAVARGVRGIIHKTHYTIDGNFQNLPTFTTEGAFNKVPWELGASGVDERARACACLGWGSGLGVVVYPASG